MLFNNALTLALAAIPLVAAEYPFNDKTQLADLGTVQTVSGKSKKPSKWLGRCGGTDLPVGKYGCGLLGTNGLLGTTIYQCVVDKGTGEPWLRWSESCMWSDGEAGGQCTRNQKRKGHKYYVGADGKKAVCIKAEDL